MPKYAVQVCYNVTYHAEVFVEAEDEAAACERAAEETDEGFEAWDDPGPNWVDRVVLAKDEDEYAWETFSRDNHASDELLEVPSSLTEHGVVCG